MISQTHLLLQNALLRLWAMLVLSMVACVCAGGSTTYDVNDVQFRGDSTLMGMKIESAYATEGAFLVETTGARYEYAAGVLKVYQGLDKGARRLLATLTFDQKDSFVKAAENADHVLLWSERFNIGIYGDSTCILGPRQAIKMSCEGNVLPDYKGRYKGELLLIDDKGGMEIYPQRYETGYDVKSVELGKKDWTANYTLKAGNRMMIAAFPGRPFNWEKSFRSNTVFTCGSMGLGHNNPYGQMPHDKTIRQWSRTFHNVVVFPAGCYVTSGSGRKPRPAGPYRIANEPEFRRFVRTAQSNRMNVLIYSSLFYFRKTSNDIEHYLQQIQDLHDQYGINGIYVDGLTFDSRPFERQHDKILNWEVVRRLRQIVGSDGVIYLHDTSLGQETTTAPNIDAHSDITLNGEGVAFRSLEDPYINYHIRKYGISNTVAMWKRGEHPASITETAILVKLLQMNGRERWSAYVRTKEPPPATPPHFGKYDRLWPTDLPAGYRDYLDRLEQQRLQQVGR